MAFTIQCKVNMAHTKGVLIFGDWRHQTMLPFTKEGGQITFMDEEVTEELIEAPIEIKFQVFEAWVSNIEDEILGHENFVKLKFMDILQKKNMEKTIIKKLIKNEIEENK